MRITRNTSPAGIGGGIIPPVRTAKIPAHAEQARNFDQVEIVTEDSFQKQLLGKLSQEVRAATTTGTVAALREKVQAGEYEVDPQAIAKKLLFVWEA